MHSLKHPNSEPFLSNHDSVAFDINDAKLRMKAEHEHRRQSVERPTQGRRDNRSTCSSSFIPALQSRGMSEHG